MSGFMPAHNSAEYVALFDSPDEMVSQCADWFGLNASQVKQRIDSIMVLDAQVKLHGESVQEPMQAHCGQPALSNDHTLTLAYCMDSGGSVGRATWRYCRVRPSVGVHAARGCA